MPNPLARSRHRLWPILSACLALFAALPVGLLASGVCHPPPDPNVAYPMYNRLLTITLPLRTDQATRDWATAAARSGPDGLTAAGLHELRHLLAAVFPGKLWVHDASSAWLESNGTQLALRNLIVELNSAADSDHCSHVFQQHLFMAAETHAADTHFNLRQFADIRVEYHHLFGACQPTKEETVHFYGALRLDKSGPACRGLNSAKDAAAVAAGLPSELHRLTDRLFFMPSSRFNSSAIDGAAASNESAPPPILLQSNTRLLAFIVDFRLRVDSPMEDWPRLRADIADRYARLSRHSDDYGIARQGAAPSCLNYLNFAGPPVAQLAASCGACFDIAATVSVNISLSESADIRPPQCETINSVRADASRRVIETRDILASLGRSNTTAHLFLPIADSYYGIRSVSCSAQPKRLVAELSLRLRARHPALLRYPLVLQSGLQRNINAYLVRKHLGLASVRLSGPLAANNADCGPAAKTIDSGLAAATGLCRNASNKGNINIVRHNFQLSLGRQSLLSQVPTARPDLTTGLVRFFLTAAISLIDNKHYWPLMHSLSLAVARRSVSTASSGSQVAALIDVEASYATADSTVKIDVNDFNLRFIRSVNQLQSDFGGPLTAQNSVMMLERRSCTNLTTSATLSAAVTAAPAATTTPAATALTTSTPEPTKKPDSTADIDANHALRLMFTVSSELLYGGRIGDYLLASGLNAALRRAGLRDIEDVDLTARDCQAGDTCRITAMVLCRNHSSLNATAGVHHISLSALTASLAGDQLLRPADLRADIVPTLPPQQIPASSVLYRYAASPYFNRPPPAVGSSAINLVRLSILWRLVSVNVSAPLAYRSLQSAAPAAAGSARLRFLLEQLLVDLLGSRLLSWPLVVSYKSDANMGRLDAAVTLEGAGSSLAKLPAEVSAKADGFPLVSFVRLSDLRVQLVQRSGDSTVKFDSALMLQSFSLRNFVSNITLQAMPDSDLQRLLSGKLRFVQSAIFSGQAGRPSLLSFEYRARRQLDASIRIEALSRIAWPVSNSSSKSAAFDEVSLTRLINSELEALQANVNVFPMAFDNGSSTLRLLDTRSGLAAPHRCELLLQFRPAPADIAVASADASWLPVADRLSAWLGANASHVSVLSLPTDPAATIDALATVSQTGPASCSNVASALMKMSSASSDKRLVAARSLSDNILASNGAAPMANLSVLVRHSALLPAYYPLRDADQDRADSAGHYFCFLTRWAHALFNGNSSESGVCVSNLVEKHRVRLNPLSDASSPVLRLSTVSAFTQMPPASVMRRFWSFKNFYLASNETFIDLDRVRVQLGQRPNISGGDSYASVIIRQLPPAPEHRPVNVTTATAATATTQSAATSQTSTFNFATVVKTTKAAVATTTTTTTTSTTTAAPPAPSVSHPAPKVTPTSTVSTAAPSATAPPPAGPYYIAVDRMATVSIDLSLPSDPWLARYFFPAKQPNQTAAAKTLSDYLLRSALNQSLQRSAWQVAADEIVAIRINVDTSRMLPRVSLDLLLPAGRSGADLETVLRAGVDQSMLLSTVFSKRNYSVSIVKLGARRYLHRPPAAIPPPAARLSVDQSMLIRLSDSAPDYLRLRATADSSAGREDLLLDFLFQQLVADACGTDVLIGRPQLVRYKADGQLAMLQLRFDINSTAGTSLQQFSSEFAAAWQRMEPTASLRHILYLDTRQGPPPPHRGLLLYQMLRLESYINKKSLMSLPSNYLTLVLRPKIKYVMQQVFPGGSASVPQFLDVDATYTKKDGALEIIALTRVAIPPGFRLAKLEQRLQLHVMQRLEQLANDINLVPSVFSVGRTDVRVVDLKEGLSQQYWCDLVYSFSVDSSELPEQGFQLANHLSQLLASKLPRHTHLERLAVLQSGLQSAISVRPLEVQALVTLSSARSLPFAEAASILIKAAAAVGPSTRLVTRAVAAPFRGSDTAAGLGPGTVAGTSARYRQVNQAVTFIGSAVQQQHPDSDKLAKYACHLYQSSLESAHWHALYVVPHSCSAIVTGSSVRVAVSQQPPLSVPGLRLNISAMVVSQTQSVDVASIATKAFFSALAIKNFYFKSDEIVLPEGVHVLDYNINISNRPSVTTASPPWVTTVPTQPNVVTNSTTAIATATGAPGVATNTTRPLVVLHYNLKLQFELFNTTWDFLSEPDTPMALLLAQSLLRDALTANATVASLARHLAVTNASRDLDAAAASNNYTGLGFGQVLARFAPPSAAPSADYLRLAVARAASTWPMAARLFTSRPLVTVWPEFEASQTTAPPSQQQNATTVTPTPPGTPSGTRRRRAAAATPSAAIVEHRLHVYGTPSLPVFYRYRDIPLRRDPLLTYLTEHLLSQAMQRWAQATGQTNSALSSDWPKLIWLRSDNSSVTLCIRYPMPGGLAQRDMMDGFAAAWVAVNKDLAGCSLCLARHQELRRVDSADANAETVGLLIYQRLQFDGFVGSNTMRKLDHDDLNQLMRHRLHFILERLYPGGGSGGGNASSLALAGFDFECYGRNSTVVAFLLVRLLARADVQEAAIRRHASDQLLGLASNEHVLPARLSSNGTDLRLLARRTGLPAGVSNWFDIQATFEYAETQGDLAAGQSLHGYALAAGARRHLEGLLLTSGASGGGNRSLSVVQLRLMRWKRLGASGLGRHHQLVTVLATLAATGPPQPDAMPADLRSLLANYTGLGGPNLTLPLQDFDHQPRHYDQDHLRLMHTGVAVRQSLHLVDSGPVEDSSVHDADQLTGDFLCLLLASAFRQRGSSRLRFVDDSCAARVTSRSLMAPHPLSARRLPATWASAYFTLHNSSRPFNPDEATDTVGQLASSLNAYADVAGRVLAAGRVAPIQPVPIYQQLRFSAAGFPEQLRNSSSPLYRQTTEAIKRALAVYLRGVANLFSGKVTSVQYRSGSVVVLVNYLVYPRLLSATLAAKDIEDRTEAMFAEDSPFHGLQLDRDGSFVATQPIADNRQPKLDKQDQQSVPIAIYCILGVACFLLLVLSTLLLVRLIRMRRNNYGSRVRPQASTNSHRRSLLCSDEQDAEKAAAAAAATAGRTGARPAAPRIEVEGPEGADSNNNNNNGRAASTTDLTRLPSTEVPPPPPPPSQQQQQQQLSQPPENRRTSSSSRQRASSSHDLGGPPPSRLRSESNAKMPSVAATSVSSPKPAPKAAAPNDEAPKAAAESSAAASSSSGLV